MDEDRVLSVDRQIDRDYIQTDRGDGQVDRDYKQLDRDDRQIYRDDTQIDRDCMWKQMVYG